MMNNKRGVGVTLFIIIILVLFLFTAIMVSVYPTMVDATLARFFTSTQLDQEKITVQDYGDSCYQDVTQCWLYRAGLNDGHISTPASDVSFVKEAKQYISSTGRACIDRYDVSARAYNVKVAPPDVTLQFNTQDVTFTMDHDVVLRYQLYRSIVTDFFHQIPIRYSWLLEFVRGVQQYNDLNLLALHGTTLEITTYDLGDDLLYDLKDPESLISAGIPYHWMWTRHKA